VGQETQKKLLERIESSNHTISQSKYASGKDSIRPANQRKIKRLSGSSLFRQGFLEFLNRFYLDYVPFVAPCYDSGYMDKFADEFRGVLSLHDIISIIGCDHKTVPSLYYGSPAEPYPPGRQAKSNNFQRAMERNNAFNSKSVTYVLGHRLPLSPVQTKGGRGDCDFLILTCGFY